jgi:flagellar hook-basal body complex protein FliE
LIDPVSINRLFPNVVQPQPKSETGAADLAGQFSSFLSNALNTVQQQQVDSDTMTQQFITGQISDVHQVLVAAEKASLGLELTVQTRNKIIEAYQDIMRMQL